MPRSLPGDSPTASAWWGFSPPPNLPCHAQLLSRGDRLTLDEIRKCLPIANLDRAVLQRDDAGSSPFVKYLIDAFPSNRRLGGQGRNCILRDD